MCPDTEPHGSALILVSPGYSLPVVPELNMFNSDICVRIPEPPAGELGLSIAGLLFPV